LRHHRDESRFLKNEAALASASEQTFNFFGSDGRVLHAASAPEEDRPRFNGGDSLPVPWLRDAGIAVETRRENDTVLRLGICTKVEIQ
jgi:hypothetical protein